MAPTRMPGYAPTCCDINIAGLHFYHNIVFVRKGRNDEESNFLQASSMPGWMTQ